MLINQLLDPCILAVSRGYHVMRSGSKHILCPMRQAHHFRGRSLNGTVTVFSISYLTFYLLQLLSHGGM